MDWRTGQGSARYCRSRPRARARRESGQSPSAGSPRMTGTEADPWDFAGPPSHLYLLTDRNRPGRPSPDDQERRIQAYCRRIVNQNKRIMALRRGQRLQDPVPSPLQYGIFEVRSIVAQALYRIMIRLD